MATLTEWTRCPSVDCDHGQGAYVDYYDGGQLFLSFWCPECEYSATEDDIRWWVMCPNCHGDEDPSEFHAIDSVRGDITENGKVKFNCENCKESTSFFPASRWDESDETPEEPSVYE